MSNTCVAAAVAFASAAAAAAVSLLSNACLACGSAHWLTGGGTVCRPVHQVGCLPSSAGWCLCAGALVTDKVELQLPTARMLHLAAAFCRQQRLLIF